MTLSETSDRMPLPKDFKSYALVIVREEQPWVGELLTPKPIPAWGSVEVARPARQLHGSPLFRPVTVPARLVEEVE